MAMELQNEIIDEIRNILCTTHTAADLAESYLRDRNPAGVEPGARDEVTQELSGFDALRERHDLLNEIAEAYFHFSAHILHEGGFFSNRQIHDLLLSPEQITGRIDDGILALELVNNAPTMVNAKSVLTARNNLRYLTREPVYLESSQVTELQMLCLREPEAITDVIRVMGQRPFVRAADGDDRPYLRAFILVLHTLIEHALPKMNDRDGVAGPEAKALIAGILTVFYHEYLSFPSEDYLADLVNRTITDKEQAVL